MTLHPLDSGAAHEQAPADPLFNQSLEKGLAVLQAFQAGPRVLTLGELEQRTGMTRSSVQRSVHTLQRLGYLQKHPQRGFYLLPKVVSLGFGYLATHPLVQAAQPYMAELSRQTGETVTLAQACGVEMVYIAQLTTPQYIPAHTPIGTSVPMYCTSCGRAFLSGQSDEEVERVLAHSQLIRRTPHTLVDRQAILARVQECRREGFALNIEELFAGDMGVAAPLVDRQGVVVATIHLAPPSSRWSRNDVRKKLGPLVKGCARAIASALPTTL